MCHCKHPGAKPVRHVSFDVSPPTEIIFQDKGDDQHLPTFPPESQQVDRWYTTEEFHNIHTEIRKTLAMFEKGSLLHQSGDMVSRVIEDNVAKCRGRRSGEEQYCLRGLESMLKLCDDGINQKKNFVRSILGIYREHQTLGIHHPERLKLFCALGSKSSRKYAELLAAQDEADASEILME